MAAGRAAIVGLPPDFGELAGFPPHVRRVVREAVVVAATRASRARDEALADRMGRAMVRELAQFLNSGRSPGEPGGEA